MKNLIFILMLSAAFSVCFSLEANASWMMVNDTTCGAEKSCPENLAPECVKGSSTELSVCVPKELAKQPKNDDGDEQVPKKKHEGPYEGNPLEGPNFN